MITIMIILNAHGCSHEVACSFKRELLSCRSAVLCGP